MKTETKPRSTFIDLRMPEITYNRLLVFFGTRAVDDNAHEILELLELLTASKLLGTAYHKAVLKAAGRS